jgi:nucleotidyltransferase/DNA polymerase involved in DNA repair
MPTRKIIHTDMDAFHAPVEQRDTRRFDVCRRRVATPEAP